MSQPFTSEHALGLAALAGVPLTGERAIEMPNRYWPESPEYSAIRRGSPWFKLDTPIGSIVVGWRKRVLNIDWSDIGIEAVATADDVTKDKHLVHAYSYAKAVEYLTAVREKLFSGLRYFEIGHRRYGFRLDEGAVRGVPVWVGKPPMCACGAPYTRLRVDDPDRLNDAEVRGSRVSATSLDCSACRAKYLIFLW